MDQITPASLQIPRDARDLRLLLRVAGIGFGIWLCFVLALAVFFPEYLFVPASQVLFSDFAETLSMALKADPYTKTGIFYPPIAFLSLYPFTLLCRGHLLEYLNGEISLEVLSAQGDLVLSYLLYFTIHLLLTVWLLLRFSGISPPLRRALAGLSLTFGPLLFCFLRGNNTLSVFFLTTAFFCLERQACGWVRELGIVALSLAISIKATPVLLCLYLLWKYRGWRRIAILSRAALYTALLTLLPMYRYTDVPLSLMQALLRNALQFSTDAGASNWSTNVSIETACYYLFYPLELLFADTVPSLIRRICSLLARLALLTTALVFALITPYTPRLRPHLVTLACAMYLLIPAVSNGYCLTVMLLPLTELLLAWQSFSPSQRRLYVICFSLILCGALYTFGVYIAASVSTMILTADALRQIAQSRRAHSALL